MRQRDVRAFCGPALGRVALLACMAAVSGCGGRTALVRAPAAGGAVGVAGMGGLGTGGAPGGAGGSVANGGAGGQPTTGTGGCPWTDQDIVVEAGVSFNAGVTGLLYHRGEIVILAITAPEPSARLYRYNLAGERLGSVDLSARPASRLLAAGDGLVLLTPAEDTLEMHWLDAAGSELSETRVPLDLEASSSSAIAAATNGDRLAVLYLVPSGARITPHGTMHVATFRLDGSPVDNAVVLSGPYIAEPRAMVATPEGWAATWVIIDESGPRHVYLTEVGRDSPASFQTSRLGSFLQGLQGGFPSVPLSAGPEGDLVMAWLDTRDTWDADDLLVLHRRSAAGLVRETTYAVAPRSFHALDLATDGDQTSVLVTTTAANGGEYAVEVRHFQGVDAGAIESYSLPGVRVRYRQIESLPAGYALAGEEAKVGDGATIKLLLRPCRE